MRNQKGLAPILIVLILAAIVGGYLVYSGKINLNKTSPTSSQNTATEQVAQPSPIKEVIKFNNGSIQICGEISDAAFPTYGHYDMRSGPEWAIDCRHIAWSMVQSGTGCPDCPPATLSEKEGVFIYNDKNKIITKIYNPQKLGEGPEFIGWIDKDSLIFKVNQKEYRYNLITKETSVIE